MTNGAETFMVGALLRRLYRTGADFDNAARLNAVLPVGDHQLAGLDARIDDGRFLARNRDLEGALLDLAIVLSDDEAIGPVGALLDRTCRNRNDISANIDFDADIDELPRPQCFVLVVEHRFVIDGAGCLIDLIVDHGEVSARQILAGRVLNGNLDLSILLGAYLRQRVPRQCKSDKYRTQLIDDDNAAAVGRPHHVAQIDEPGTGPAIDRRANLGIVDLSLRHVDHCLVGRNGGFELRNERSSGIEILPASGPRRGQLARPAEIDACVIELRLVFELVRSGLRQCRLEWGGIDLEQHVAGLDFGSFREIDLDDLTVHPRLY